MTRSENSDRSEFCLADQRHLNAAEGWIGLGNWQEANEELEQISAAMRSHPRILAIRYLVYSKAERWEMCVEMGRALVEVTPDDAFSWVSHSYALRRAPSGGVQAAYDALLPAPDRVKDLEQITFNLACYSCQLGRIKEAREWLTRSLAEAARHGRIKKRRLEALNDPDLEPLWSQIGSDEI